MRYVALGDSITAFRDGVQVYFELLQDDLQGGTFAMMVNSGVGGWHTSNLSALLQEKCLQFRPHMVSCMLGTNDHAIYKGKSEPAVPLALYESNLREIVQRIRQTEHGDSWNGGKPFVILMTPPYIATYTNRGGTDCNRERLEHYVAVVKRLAAELGTGLVDVYSITGDAAEWDDERFTTQFTAQLDGCHLNSQGQKLIYKRLVEELRCRLSMENG
ncbi:MAG: lysophospholipase L1-like esterase [Paenibacillus sp.]|nr:lysophospholipase L1-like esterase [Paenibacillus sp.]